MPHSLCVTWIDFVVAGNKRIEDHGDVWREDVHSVVEAAEGPLNNGEIVLRPRLTALQQDSYSYMI